MYTLMPAKHKIIASLCLSVLVFVCPCLSYGATVTYTYDNLNRLTKVVYGDGTTEEFTYDAAGNRLSQVVQVPDHTPPAPDPMTWATTPHQTGTGSIAMVATAATDPTTPIEYYFGFVGSPTGGTGGANSGWQPGTSYTDSGLQANHQYGYQVKARDGANNETAYSSPIQYAYTAIETPTGINFGTVTSSSLQVQSTNTPLGLNRGNSGLVIENITNGTSSGWKQNNDFWTSSPLSPNASYSFQTKARNGDSVETGYSPSASKYTLSNAPGVSSFSNVTQTCIRTNWVANGNPNGTQYYCENTTNGTNSGWITSSFWDSCSLTCGTAYNFSVKARNGDGVETDWTSLGSQPTLACDDMAPPSLSITSHSSGQHVSISNITLAGTASDSGKGDNGIQQVTVNGLRANNDTATGSGTTNWSLGLTLSAGANTIIVMAYDNSSNNNTTTQNITIYYDSPNIFYTVNPNAPYSYIYGDNQITTWQGNLNEGYYDLPLGDFDFRFYGVLVSNLRISTNGYITFGTDGTNWNNVSIPNVGLPNALIAPFWDDLDLTGLSGDRGVWWGVSGTAPNRQLVIEWHQVPSLQYGTETYGFEVILYESTDRIKFQYLDVDSGTSHDLGVSATVGIENFDGTRGVQYSFNGSKPLSNGLAIEFTPADFHTLVTKYYNDVLGRSPEPGGAEGWTSEVERIVSLGIDVREGFQALAKFFFNSEEYHLQNKSDAQFVIDLYQTFLNRDPDPDGFNFWVNYLAQGLTRNMLISQFAYCEEFKLYVEGLFGSGATRPEDNLVNDLYRGFLNRFPDTAGFNGWVGLMRGAQCAGAQAVRDTTCQIALAFIQSVEYGLRGRNNLEYVEDLYNGILRRGGDPGGFVFWVNLLNSWTYTRQQVLKFFTDSEEFQFRVLEVIDAGCLQ